MHNTSAEHLQSPLARRYSDPRRAVPLEPVPEQRDRARRHRHPVPRHAAGDEAREPDRRLYDPARRAAGVVGRHLAARAAGAAARAARRRRQRAGRARRVPARLRAERNHEDMPDSVSSTGAAGARRLRAGCRRIQQERGAGPVAGRRRHQRGGARLRAGLGAAGAGRGGAPRSRWWPMAASARPTGSRSPPRVRRDWPSSVPRRFRVGCCAGTSSPARVRSPTCRRTAQSSPSAVSP